MRMSLRQLTAQIEKLQMEAQANKAKEAEGVIARIKEAVGHYGLTAADPGLRKSRGGAECRRRGLYQPSIQVNNAMRASAWLWKLRRSISSHSRLAKKLSAIALS